MNLGALDRNPGAGAQRLTLKDRRSRERAADEVEKAAVQEARKKAKAILAARWEKPTLERSWKQLDLLRQTTAEWESQTL
jgi:hypothetical protein